MYEEPYRWIEAVGNRRHYLDEQFREGSPVVGLPYADGLLLLTISRGTPKLYEIYDRIGWGGMGHPADLEKLRFSLLEMAHVEGFNRSPADVTGSRLVKYGLAPTIKQAFEEVFKAPFIVKILLAELGGRPERDAFVTINYDGTFDETTQAAVLAASPDIQRTMIAYAKKRQENERAVRGPLADTLTLALQTWAVGSVAQQRIESDTAADRSSREALPELPDETSLQAHLRDVLREKSIECAVLERHLPGSSKYRTVKPDEWQPLLPSWLR